MSRNQKIIVTFALVLSNTMVGLDSTIVNTALPAIVSSLHGIQYMGWIIAVFLLTMSVSTPLWSKFGERKGNKLAYIVGTSVFALGALFQGFAPNMVVFLLARALMGVGAGGMNTIPFIIYAQIFKNLKRRAQVLGLSAAGNSTGSIIGPLAGGWIVDTLGWHWVFFINIPIALVSIGMIIVFLRLKEKLNKSTIDYRGAALLISGLSMLLVGIQLIGVTSIWIILSFALVGFILLALMAKVESTAKDPIIPGRLFKNPVLMIDVGLFVILWGAFVAFNIYTPMWVQGIMGLSALVGGMTQIPGALTNVVGSEVSPLIQGRLGRYKLILIGTFTFLIAYVGMTMAKQDISYGWLLFFGACQGFGIGMCFSVLQVGVQADVELRDIPIATSFAYLVRFLSQTFMSTIYGVILNKAMSEGTKQSNGAITMGMLNKLSDANTVGSLPKHLLPAMKTILFTGIHNIMVVALIFVIAAGVLTMFAFRVIRKHPVPVRN